MRKRLVDLHTRAAGIGKSDLNGFAFKRFDKDIAAKHSGADFGAFGGLGRGSGFALRSGVFDRFTHTLICVVAVGAGNKKPTAVSSRGFLLKFTLTRSRGIAGYDDNQYYSNLFNVQ